MSYGIRERNGKPTPVQMYSRNPASLLDFLGAMSSMGAISAIALSPCNCGRRLDYSYLLPARRIKASDMLPTAQAEGFSGDACGITLRSRLTVLSRPTAARLLCW